MVAQVPRVAQALIPMDSTDPDPAVMAFAEKLLVGAPPASAPSSALAPGRPAARPLVTTFDAARGWAAS
jgi:hypothetical protein